MEKRLAVLTLSCALIIMAAEAQMQEVPKKYQDVLNVLGRKGDFKDDVLKVNIPRNDLSVAVKGTSMPTAFGFGGWIAMTRGDEGKEVMMGDLVLLEDEVNPVMSALLDNGLQVTALHNHFFWEEPRVFYMHLHGHGVAADLAREVKPALDLIGHVRGASVTIREGTAGQKAQSAVQGSTNRLSANELDRIIGHRGETSGTVYKVVVDRDDLSLVEMGARINSRMGLNTWAAITGNDADAAIAGDVAMKESEVNRVLKALRKNDLDVVAIHQHMFGTTPNIVFLHYWGKGPAAKLASGFRAALEELGNKQEMR